MTVYDLMLGDVVRFEGLYNGVIKPLVGEVTKLCDIEILSIIGTNEDGYLETVSYDISYFEPVEITDELLVNNGFKKDETDFYTDFYYGEVGEGKKIIRLHKDRDGGYAVYGNRNVIIHYLHELQHILKQIGLQIAWNI